MTGKWTNRNPCAGKHMGWANGQQHLRFDTRIPPIVMLSGLRPTIFILSDNTKMTSIQTKFILKENVHQYVSTLNFSEFNRIETVMQSTNWQFYLSHKFVKEINL